MTQLILASQSPDRLRLLQAAGYKVVAIPAQIDEPDPAQFADWQAALMQAALLKARAVWNRGASGLIVAADTVGVVAGQILGKPADRTAARRMLAAISGTQHAVCTGWCLLRTRDGLHISGVETTTITMRAWSTEELDRYLDSGDWIDKSGAYALQWPGDPFVTNLQGSAANVIGLPLERLADVLPLCIENAAARTLSPI